MEFRIQRGTPIEDATEQLESFIADIIREYSDECMSHEAVISFDLKQSEDIPTTYLKDPFDSQDNAKYRLHSNMIQILTDRIREGEIAAQEFKGARKALVTAYTDWDERSIEIINMYEQKERQYEELQHKGKRAKKLIEAMEHSGTIEYRVILDTDKNSETYGAFKAFAMFRCGRRMIGFGMKSDGFITGPGFFAIPNGYEPAEDEFIAC